MAKYTLRFSGNGVFPDGVIEISEGQYVLDALEDAGYDVPYSSRVGADSSSVFFLVSGSVDSSDGLFLSDEENAKGLFEGDVTYVTSNSSIIFLGDEGYDYFKKKDENSDGYNERKFEINGAEYKPGESLPGGATHLNKIVLRNYDEDDLGGSVNLYWASEYVTVFGWTGYARTKVKGTSMDEAVLADEFGNYVEADFFNTWGVLFASGASVTDGMILIEPHSDKLPSFAIPVRSGMEAFSKDSMFYHEYEFSVSLPLEGYDELRYSQNGLAMLEKALIANPTPGDDSPASINGTVNDAGDIGPMDGNTNMVYSFVIPNPDPDQSDIIVNYTMRDDHILPDGYVARMIQRYDNTPDDLTDADYGYELITIGEGDAVLQSAPLQSIAEYYAESAWHENALEVFNYADDLLK